MKFHNALGGAEPSPVKDAKPHVNGLGVERIEFVIIPRAMAWDAPLALGKEFADQALGAHVLIQAARKRSNQ